MNKILFLLFLFPIFTFTQSNLYPKSKGQLVNHSYYSLSYNENHEQAEWVYYFLTSDMINGTYKRTDNFREDRKVITGSASKSDYYKSGYDRGHLAPAGDMKISRISMSESFLLSNISPQNPSFNRGVWKNLESQIRSWVLSEGGMYIVTGPVLVNPIGSIGINSVTVPSSFYKIVYSRIDHKMIGFIIPNCKTNNNLKDYVKSVDYIEDLTGIDFFYDLEQKKQDELESEINMKKWYFTKIYK